MCFVAADSAALGGALRAAHGYYAQADPRFTYAELLSKAADDGAAALALAVEGGDPKLHDAYGLQARRKLEVENSLVREYGVRH